MGMKEYTEWCIKYPWHITPNAIIPKDCSCEHCQKERDKEARLDGEAYDKLARYYGKLYGLSKL